MTHRAADCREKNRWVIDRTSDVRSRNSSRRVRRKPDFSSLLFNFFHHFYAFTTADYANNCWAIETQNSRICSTDSCSPSIPERTNFFCLSKKLNSNRFARARLEVHVHMLRFSSSPLPLILRNVRSLKCLSQLRALSVHTHVPRFFNVF